MLIENNEMTYNPLSKASNRPGIEFSNIEIAYSDKVLEANFKEFMASKYPGYIEDKEKFEKIRKNEGLLDKNQVQFIKEFLTREMAFKIQFFGNLYKQVDHTERSKYVPKTLGKLLSSNDKKELSERLAFLERLYIVLRNSGKTHEEITS